MTNIFITTNDQIKTEYFNLRLKIFKQELFWEKYESNIELDKKSHLLVATNELDEVIAGVQILLSKDSDRMANESERYSYAKVFEKNGVLLGSFAEIDNMIIEQSHRKLNIIENLIENIVSFLRQNKVVFLICVQSESRSRLYSKVLKKYGALAFIKEPWSSLEQYNFSKDFLTIYKL